MTRLQDMENARAAADAWATSKGYPVSGGYSADWYVNGYLGGHWPAGWLKWWADYQANPGSIVSGDTVAHQFSSTPIDQDQLADSEIISQEVDVVSILSYLDGPVVGPLRTYKSKKIKAVVAEIDRVAKQFGVA